MSNVWVRKNAFLSLSAIGALFVATLSPTSSAIAEESPVLIATLTTADGFQGILNSGCTATGFSVTVGDVEYTNGDVISDFPTSGFVPSDDTSSPAGRFTVSHGDGATVEMVHAVALQDEQQETVIFPFYSLDDPNPLPYLDSFNTPMSELTGSSWSDFYLDWKGKHALEGFYADFYPSVITHPCDVGESGLAYVQVFPGIVIDSVPMVVEDWWELPFETEARLAGSDPAYTFDYAVTIAATLGDFPNAAYAFWANYLWSGFDGFERNANAAFLPPGMEGSSYAELSELGIELALWSYSFGSADWTDLEFFQTYAAVDSGGQAIQSSLSEPDPVACSPGTYSVNGSQPCIVSPAGKFVATSGADEAIECPVGTYQPNQESTACLNADPGRFVAFTGSASQILCPVGTYQPNAASTDCILSDPGYFVASPGSIEQTLCPSDLVSKASASVCYQARSAIPSTYVGPVIQKITADSGSADETLVTGLRLSTIDQVSVNSQVLTQRLDANGNLFFDTSSLAAGTYRVEFLSSIAGVTYYAVLVIEAKAVTATSTSDQKVNAGSFKGYVAVYAKGYEGQRLSAKVGKDWVIVSSIPSSTNDLYRHVEFTGAGVDVAVRIYINRVLIDTINLTTK